jgi:hypothetical protein
MKWNSVSIFTVILKTLQKQSTWRDMMISSGLIGRSVGQLLDEFASLRSENLGELRALNLRQEDLGRRGRHPALGVVTLSVLLATWAAHDLTHLHQISRVMAHQYREAVGLWRGYLGVLQCGSHSAPS